MATASTDTISRKSEEQGGAGAPIHESDWACLSSKNWLAFAATHCVITDLKISLSTNIIYLPTAKMKASELSFSFKVLLNTHTHTQCIGGNTERL